MQTFSEIARTCGVLIGDLYPSDRNRRCATTARRSKNGAYFREGLRGWSGIVTAKSTDREAGSIPGRTKKSGSGRASATLTGNGA